MTHPNRFLLAGVMGFPVMHSRSPMLHNYWFKAHSVPGAYVPLAIAPEGLEAALRALGPLGFSGCNLTIPHKETAFKFVDEVDDTAKKIGAISCVVVRKDGTLFGTNNDWYGFIESLLEECPDWRANSGPVVVIGAGGAARAVVYALVQRGAKEIRLVNRTRARANALVEDIGGPVKVLDWAGRNAALAEASLLVNTTSQGMVGQTPLDLSLDGLPNAAIVYDVVYIPGETPLLAAARKKGHRVVNGLGMLLHQARPAWRDWFGIEPHVTGGMRAMIEATI